MATVDVLYRDTARLGRGMESLGIDECGVLAWLMNRYREFDDVRSIEGIGLKILLFFHVSTFGFVYW